MFLLFTIDYYIRQYIDKIPRVLVPPESESLDNEVTTLDISTLPSSGFVIA